MRRIYFILSLLYLATLFTSCKDDEKNGFIISPKEMNLVAGETKTIKVNGGVSGYDFISGNQYIASVENDGVITALRVGQTDIGLRVKIIRLQMQGKSYRKKQNVYRTMHEIRIRYIAGKIF